MDIVLQRDHRHWRDMQVKDLITVIEKNLIREKIINTETIQIWRVHLEYAK